MTPRHRLTDAPLLCALLDRPVLVHVSTVSAQGRPQASIVWAQRRDDEIVMVFSSRSAKVRNLLQNPHVAFVVVDHEALLEPGVPAYAQLTGRAVLRTESPALIDDLALAYGQAGGFAHPKTDFITIHVDVERVTGMGPIEGGRMGGWAPPAGSQDPTTNNPKSTKGSPMTSHVTANAYAESGWLDLDPSVAIEAVEGDPRVRELPVSADRGGVDVGFATGQPARFSTHLGRTEVLYVVEGRLTAELAGGVVVDLAPGDFIQLDGGQDVTWTYHEAIRLFYVLHGMRA